MFGSRKRKNRRLTFKVNSDDNVLSTEQKASNDSKVLKLIRKGKEKKFDTDNAERIINHLANYPHKEIRSLSGKLKEDYNQLLRYVELLYGHKYYNILLNLIKTNFQFKGKIKPFTIAAYMTGCTINTNLDNNSCSTLCSGNIKHSDKGEDDFCDHPVVSATFDQYKSVFVFLCTEGDDSKDRIAFVHVEYSNLRSFPGFNDNEKNWFRRKGFEKIYLYGTTNHKKYNNLYAENNGEPVPVDDIKARMGKIKYVPSDFSMNNATLIGIGLVVVIILLFFFYVYYRSKNEHQGRQKPIYDE